MCQTNTKQNKAGVAILISDEVEFNAKPLIGMVSVHNGKKNVTESIKQ